MILKIECEIKFDETMWFNDDEEKEWFIETLTDKENTMVILWSSTAGEEIGQTSNFKYEIL
jgi:hypothetical protein